jgi:hypothetical protein
MGKGMLVWVKIMRVGLATSDPRCTGGYGMEQDTGWFF